MIRKITYLLVLGICVATALAGRCKVEDDFAEISALDSNFWAALDKATVNAGILGWSNQTIFNNFKTNVLLPHVTSDFKFTTIEPTGPRVIVGIDAFAQFAVDAYARGLRGEFHISGSLDATCIDKDKYLIEKFDVDLTKTVVSAANVYGRKSQVFVSTCDGLRIESMILYPQAIVPLASVTYFPFQ